MTEDELLTMCKEFALVDEVNIIKDKATCASRGCCFVICPSRDEADKAVNACHNKKTLPGVFHCLGQYFCLHFEAFQLGMAPVYMAFLHFMGDENDARTYTYSLEVGANGRKLIWEGTPRSIRDSHRKVRDSHDSLIIQRNMPQFFSSGDRKELKLRVTGRIWKEEHNPDIGVCIPNLCS